MTAGDQPLIIVGELEHLATLSRSALADVLVTTADRHRPDKLYDRLFTDYPGLALAVAVGDGGAVHLGSRDGRMLLLVCTGRPVSLHSAWLRALAFALYAELVRRAQ
ncbi:hypothetical protein [Actinoplanes sp. NPDC049599]|uniref:hypothetical protein n=1 Tax=Actinoplanes sp. NPDC049599 TaxID=3363903 RepID=UPI0037A58461